MAVIGADPDQLRATANQFLQAADRLQESLKGLHTFISNSAMWRGPDSERFRSEWNGQSVFALNGAISALRAGADILRRNADEQDTASQANGGSGVGQGAGSSAACYEPAATGLSGMWQEIGDTPNGGDMSGYRVQKVVGEDGVERYIVYIAGTTLAGGTQHLGANFWAISGSLDADSAQVAALERLIPDGAEVMLVGHSQGGLDAQNIAASGKFNVQQIVTFGSPVRNDLNISAIHLHYGEDVVGYAGGVNPGLYSASGQEGNDNVEVFSSKASPLTVFGLDKHFFHYGDLAEQWDGAATTGQNARAAESAEDLKRFQGNVVDQVDIDVKGNGSW